MNRPPLPGGSEAWTVSEAVARARMLLEQEFASVRVQGEISRFLHHRSGHMYFTLKDQGAAVSAAMFRSDNQRLRFTPEDGMDVLVEGRLTLYEPRGQFQLVVSRMEPLGVGSLHVAFEQLKARLVAEGLFDAGRKRPLPLLPRRIGMATSPSGAALRDMLRVLDRRFAGVEVLIAPCRVQGEGAAAEIVEALRRLERAGVDLILLARGGGSLEDLWAFNEEPVARAVAGCSIPVVTGIGHETDLSIADLAADCHAPTPSAAAEIAVRSRLELSERVGSLARRLRASARLILAAGRERIRRLREQSELARIPRRLLQAAQQLDELTAAAARAAERRVTARRTAVLLLRERLSPASLGRRVGERRTRLAHLDHRAGTAVRGLLASRRREMRRLADLLGSVSPLAVLGRGYAICRTPEGAVLRSSSAVRGGDPVQVRLHRGELDCVVRSTIPSSPEEPA